MGRRDVVRPRPGSVVSAKHRDPEYMRNARIIRHRVKTEHRAGRAVPCWRCRGAIAPGQPFDVGHVAGAIGHSMTDLAAEHRHKTGLCPGNRSTGGRVGAAVTNSKHAPSTPAAEVKTWAV
jgi:hypothetical protein